MTRLSLLSPAQTPRSWLQLGLVLGALGCAARPPVESAATAPEPAEPTPAAESAPATAPEPSAATPTASSGSAAPADARGRDQIQAVIAANRERVRACYDAAQKNNPGIQGDLVVTFVINPDGSVKSAEVDAQESELHVPELDSCAVEALKALKFPASSRGLESKVNYPFNFKPSQPQQPGSQPSGSSNPGAPRAGSPRP